MISPMRSKKISLSTARSMVCAIGMLEISMRLQNRMRILILLGGSPLLKYELSVLQPGDVLSRGFLMLLSV